MQTPLQELIEWNEKELLEAKHVIDNAKDYDEMTLAMADHYYRVHYQVKAKATELLEKERQIIKRSYDDGYYSGVNRHTQVLADNGSDYYTKTVTNESK